MPGRRQDVLERLLGGSTDIVIAGDSMMRQLFVRLIQLLRGRHRVFDYRVGGCSSVHSDTDQRTQNDAVCSGRMHVVRCGANMSPSHETYMT